MEQLFFFSDFISIVNDLHKAILGEILHAVFFLGVWAPQFTQSNVQNNVPMCEIVKQRISRFRAEIRLTAQLKQNYVSLDRWYSRVI